MGTRTAVLSVAVLVLLLSLASFSLANVHENSITAETLEVGETSKLGKIISAAAKVAKPTATPKIAKPTASKPAVTLPANIQALIQAATKKGKGKSKGKSAAALGGPASAASGPKGKGKGKKGKKGKNVLSPRKAPIRQQAPEPQEAVDPEELAAQQQAEQEAVDEAEGAMGSDNPLELFSEDDMQQFQAAGVTPEQLSQLEQEAEKEIWQELEPQLNEEFDKDVQEFQGEQQQEGEQQLQEEGEQEQQEETEQQQDQEDLDPEFEKELEEEANVQAQQELSEELQGQEEEEGDHLDAFSEDDIAQFQASGIDREQLDMLEREAEKSIWKQLEPQLGSEFDKDVQEQQGPQLPPKLEEEMKKEAEAQAELEVADELAKQRGEVLGHKAPEVEAQAKKEAEAEILKLIEERRQKAQVKQAISTVKLAEIHARAVKHALEIVKKQPHVAALNLNEQGFRDLEQSALRHLQQKSQGSFTQSDQTEIRKEAIHDAVKSLLAKGINVPSDMDSLDLFASSHLTAAQKKELREAAEREAQSELRGLGVIKPEVDCDLNPCYEGCPDAKNPILCGPRPKVNCRANPCHKGCKSSLDRLRCPVLRHNATSSLSVPEVIYLVNRHNEVRRMLGLNLVEWDVSLSQGAQQWADQCNFKHSTADFRNKAYAQSKPTHKVRTVGENLVADAFEPAGAKLNLDAIIQQAEWWNCKRNLCSRSQSGDRADCGSFLQAFSTETTRFGCGYRLCEVGSPFGTDSQKWNNFVCWYNPMHPANTRPFPASQCKYLDLDELMQRKQKDPKVDNELEKITEEFRRDARKIY